jgi:hypothetical protein
MTTIFTGKHFYITAALMLSSACAFCQQTRTHCAQRLADLSKIKQSDLNPVQPLLGINTAMAKPIP